MDADATMHAPVDAATLFAAVRRLDGFNQWLDIVRRVEPAGENAWTVDLGGEVGGIVRTKRLRMRRTLEEPPADGRPGRVRFEREELDGRQHSAWVLDATVTPQPAATGAAELHMRLHYSGTLFIPLLERLITATITRSRPRFLEHLEAMAQVEETPGIGAPHR